MLQINYRKVAELIPYVNNSRTHNEKQVKQIAASIKEFGFNNPILIDEEMGIIAGHGRLEAAELLRITAVPTIVLKGLTEAQKKAYVIADNKLALNADWDYETLKLEIMDLDADIDLSLLGFDDDELASIVDGLDEVEAELEEEEYKEIFNIIVTCKDENHQERVYNELLEKGYECQVQSL